MNIYQLEGFDLIDSIGNYVNEYSEFISLLDSNYLKLKQEIEDQLVVSKDDNGSHVKWQIS